MKKKILLILGVVMLVSLTACGGKMSNVGGALTSIVEKDNEYVMPAKIANASSYTTKTVDEIKTQAEKAGYKFSDVVKNDDGSITFKMKEAEVKKIQDVIHGSFNAGIVELLKIGDGRIFPHIKSVKEADDFSKCTVVTTEAGPSLNDESLASFFFMTAGEYNTFLGDPFKDVSCEFVNESSGNVVNTVKASSYWNK